MIRRPWVVPAAAIGSACGFAALMAVVLATAPGVFFLDAEIADRLHRFVLARPDLGTTLRVVGFVTLPNWLRLIALFVAVRLWRRGHRRPAVWLALTMAIGGVLGIVLKQIFARTRPEWPEAITVASGYSFPSGHALNSMLAAGCTIVLLDRVLTPTGRRRLRMVAAGFVLLVGFDRLGLGVHYLTDVLAGWSLALAILFTSLALVDPLRSLNSATASGSGGAPGSDKAPESEETLGSNRAGQFDETPGSDGAPGFDETRGSNDAPGFDETRESNGAPGFGETRRSNGAPGFGETRRSNGAPGSGETPGSDGGSRTRSGPQR